MRKWRASLLLFVLASIAVVSAAAAAEKAVSGLILSAGTEARGLAMGDAQAGVIDATSAQLNPAAATALKVPRVSAFLRPAPFGEMSGNVGYAHPFGFGTLVGAVTYHTLGSAEFVTSDGTAKSVNAGTDIVIQAGFGRPVTDTIKAGVNVKYLSSELVETYSASSVVVDAGMNAALPVEGLTAGLVLRNLGSGLKYYLTSEKLPTEVRAGGAYATSVSGVDILGAADFIYGVSAQTTGAGVGVEATWNKMISVRVGYLAGNDLKSIVAGVGFVFNGIRLDYAAEPMSNSFGMGNGVSLSYDFRP